MAADCPVTMECDLVESLQLSRSILFVGDVAKVYADEEVLTDGAVDLSKTEPLLLSMPDNHYWPLGDATIGEAWSAGSGFAAETTSNS